MRIVSPFIAAAQTSPIANWIGSAQRLQCISRSTDFRRGIAFALMMPNVLQYPIALMGCLRFGLTVVNCNPLYTARELEHQLRDSGPKAFW